MSQKKNRQDTESALRNAAPAPPRISAERSLLILRDALESAESARLAEAERAARGRRVSASHIRFALCGVSGLAAMITVALLINPPPSSRLPATDTSLPQITRVSDSRAILASGHILAAKQERLTDDAGIHPATPTPALQVAAHTIHRHHRHGQERRSDLAATTHPNLSLSSYSAPGGHQDHAPALDTADSVAVNHRLIVVVTKPVPQLTVNVDHAPDDDEGYARSSAVQIDEDTGRRVWVQCALVSGDRTPYIALRSDQPPVSETMGVSESTPAGAVVTGALDGLSGGTHHGTPEGKNPL